MAKHLHIFRFIPFLGGIIFIFGSLHHCAFSQKSRFEDRFWDIQHYVFHLRLSDSHNLIQGEARIHTKILQACTTFSLDLVKKQATGKGMLVSKVSMDGRPLRFEHKGEVLEIFSSEKAFLPGLQTFTIHYEGIPADGLVISQNKYGERTFFGDNWPERARHWLPCVDHPSDKATCEFIIRAPAHYRVVANGQLQQDSLVPEGQRLSHWRCEQPLPTKVMVIGVARFVIDTLATTPLPIQSWVYPQDQRAGFQDMKAAPQIMSFFTQKIAPYPFDKLYNVQSTTRYGGMENAGNIFYDENAITGQNTMEALLAHEIAHQWFGNTVSEADWPHLWLSEGFATYLTHVYMGQQYGQEAFQKRLDDDRSQVIYYARLHPQNPVVDTTGPDPKDLLTANSYQKGAWILHMLREEVGEEAFWKGLQKYYSSFRFGNATSQDFAQIMETISGKSLGQFFRQWLYQPGVPILDLSWEHVAETGLLRIALQQSQKGTSAWELPLALDLYYPNRKEAQRVVLPMSEKKQEFWIETPVAPFKIVLDPKTQLLFERGKVQKSP